MIPASEQALACFGRGYNCAQAVFSTFAARYGLDESTALRMASMLGGGLARRGEVCGAVTGALLALGLGRGSDQPDGKEAAYRLGQDFLQRFEARFGALTCRQLLGCDLGTPAGLQQARESGILRTLCPRLVGESASIVEAMLSQGA
jgi:C_GCAxxG_C_C family probable redox protein